MIELAWPWVLTALGAPLLALLTVARRRAGPGGVYLPFFAAASGWPAPPGGRGPGTLVCALACALAWTALVVAAARPQWIGEPIARQLHGRDLMLAIDVSGSMATRDMRVGGRALTRLETVKQVAADFIARRVDDRVGLIVFGSRAYVHVPLTFDRAMVAGLVAETGLGLAGLDTALGDAIGLAVKRLRGQPATSRVLVVLSDGDSRAGRLLPVEAARLAAAHGLRIYTIGLGPQGDAGSQGALEAVAARTGGRHFQARDVESLRSAYRSIDAFEPVASGAELVRPVRELFRWPLTAAVLLGAIAVLAPVLTDWRRLAVRGGGRPR